MLVYMVRDRNTGLFYKRKHGRYLNPWVSQEEASIWTKKSGASACLGVINKEKRGCNKAAQVRDPEILTFPVFANKLVFIVGDDWEGMYQDGVLVQEGHRLRISDVLRQLNVPYLRFSADQEWLESRGSLPRNLNGVKTEEPMES